MLFYFLIILLGLFAGTLNTLAGGGSLIVLPILILFGIPPTIANGTNRIAIFVQTLTSTLEYKRNDFLSFKTGLHFALPAAFGAIFGSLISVKMSDEVFQLTLGIILIIVAVWLIFNNYISTSIKKTETKNFPISLYLTFILIGVYGGFMQAGVGYLLLIVLNGWQKYPLSQANVYKVFIAMIYTIIAITIFIYKDKINWPVGLALALGNGIGGWIGCHLNIRGGDKLIKAFLFISFD